MLVDSLFVFLVDDLLLRVAVVVRSPLRTALAGWLLGVSVLMIVARTPMTMLVSVTVTDQLDFFRRGWG